MISDKTEQVTDKQWKKEDNLTPWKRGQSGNPLGKPRIKTNACYWAAKYSQFTLAQIKKEIAKPDLKAIQIAVLRDWQQMVKNPTEANFAWARLRDQYERDEPVDNGPPVHDIHITISRV